MSRFLRIAFCLATGIVCSLGLWAADNTPGPAIQNEFIRAVVNRGPDEAGRFSIGTTGGDPARPLSKNAHLIYGGNVPWTSYTTVRIGNVNYAFGGPTKRQAGLSAKLGKMVKEPAVVDGKLVCAWEYDNVTVEQELSIVRGVSTRMMDTIAVTYSITNNRQDAVPVGLRMLLDTMCGTNDGAPIRGAGTANAITGATVLAGKDVPDGWQAFDNLANPSVISQGTLKGGSATSPDKIIFADWGTLAEEPWEPAIKPGQTFIRKDEDEPDTSAAMFWSPAEIKAGDTRTITTYYGIGYVLITPGKLTLGLNAPAETVYEYERTDTFTITGYLENTGGFDARDVALSLQLPEGLTLVSGKVKQTMPSVKMKDSLQASWVVKPNGKGGGNSNITLNVTSANVEGNHAAFPIEIIVPVATIKCTPNITRVPLMGNDGESIIPVYINLTPADNFTGARFVLTFDPKVIMPFAVSPGVAFVSNDLRYLEWDVDRSAAGEGRITITARRTGAAPLSKAEANLAIVKFYAAGVGSSPLNFERAVLLGADNAEKAVSGITGKIEVTQK